MTVADIITEFGAYYINSGQNKKDLVKKAMHKSVTETLFTRVVTDDTVIRRGSATMTRILQPFQKTWSPTGALTVVPQTIPLYEMKGDFQDYPDDLEKTWLGFLSGDELDRKTWPFVKWFLEEFYFPKMEEDLELNEIFGGVYTAPPTPGTAGVAGTAMNGVKKIINDHITAGRITPIATGAPSATPATWVDQVEAFCASVEELYRYKPMNLVMSETLAARFRTGMRVKYNTQYNQVDELTKVIDYNKTIVGVPSHTGQNKIWMTPKENAIIGIKKGKNQNTVAIEGIDRLVKIYTDYYKGVGFPLPGIVYTNDQNLS